MMRITRTALSDGRELIYYDESGGVDRSTPDGRGLEPFHAASELRRDPLTDQWTIIAAHRQERTHLPPTDACPLCPSTPERSTEVPAADYDVVVFENRFPSLSSGSAGWFEGTATRRPGEGRCEVVCFSADHDTSFARLSPTRVRTVLDAWADRTTALSELPGVAQVFPFENRGREIGVTLTHPHGQIYAYPFVSPRSERMIDTARAHEARTGRNLFADVLASEQAGERVVARNAHWTAFVPVAARWPVEVHVFPNRHVPDLAALTAAERDAFAPLYLDLLARGDALHGRPLPYIAAWYQAPVRTARDLGYLHLQVFSTRRAPDKLKYLAGSEAAMGVFINDVQPERLAESLRAAC